MIVGTSDGGAHLDRDDGAEAHSWFLQHWVREWGGFTLEEGVRQITPSRPRCAARRPGAAAARLRRRPVRLRPRHRRPDRKEFVHDFPNGAGRWTSPAGGRARHHRQRRAHRARRRAAARRRPPRPGPRPQRTCGLMPRPPRRSEGPCPRDVVGRADTGGAGRAAVRGVVLDGEVAGRRRAARPGRGRGGARPHRAGRALPLDVSVIDGTIPFPTPVVLGHEGAGVVEAVGAGVRRCRRATTSCSPRSATAVSATPATGASPPTAATPSAGCPAPTPWAGRRRSSSPTPAVFTERTIVRDTPGRGDRPGGAVRRRLPDRLRRRDRHRRRAQPGQGPPRRDGRGDRRRRHRPVGGPGGPHRRRRPHRRHRRQPGEGGRRPPVRRHRLRRRRHRSRTPSPR